MKKILILGGGFAGVEVAIYLRKKGFEVTIISNRDFLYIYPTSIWIPVGTCSFENNCISLESLKKVHGFNLIIDEVEVIKTKEKKVYCKNETYEFEYLVIAIGSGKMVHKGIENTLTICGEPNESIKLKDKIDELIKNGSGKISMGFGANPIDASNVRGGPAFELLFNLHNKLQKLGIRDNFELTFFAPMSEPGARMGANALKLMDKFYKKLNIKRQVGKKILKFKKSGILFEDDIFVRSDLTMFIPAGDGHNVFKNSSLSLNEAGLININDFCEVLGEERVYAIGDSVALKGPNWRAKQGHLAEVMAKNVAFNIDAKSDSEKKGYTKHLSILCVMDSGNGAMFVYRSEKRALMIPLPIIGHWLKKGWGWYYKNSKLNKIPRIPRM
jgi:sulfide:quinone oxidoreductase